MEQWLVKQILSKEEYDTAEYCAKERRSKFRINARQKEQDTLNTATGIIGLWSATKKVEMSLFNLMQNTNNTHTDNDKWTWTIKQ